MPPPNRTSYDSDLLEKLERGLDALPAEPSKRPFTKRGYILALLPKIESLQQRGYTVRAIAETISELGLPISPIVLRGYLASKGSQGKKGKKRPRRSVRGAGAASAGGGTKAAEGSWREAPAVKDEALAKQPQSGASIESEASAKPSQSIANGPQGRKGGATASLRSGEGPSVDVGGRPAEAAGRQIPVAAGEESVKQPPSGARGQNEASPNRAQSGATGQQEQKESVAARPGVAPPKPVSASKAGTFVPKDDSDEL